MSGDWVRGRSLGAATWRVAGPHGIFVVHVLALRGRGGDQGSAEEEKIAAELGRLRGLRHPNIVGVHDFSLDSGQLRVYSDFAGDSITKVLADFGPLPEPLLGRCVEGILTGLSFLHTREPPLAHGSIKGDNIHVTGDCRVRLRDCGRRELPVRRPDFSKAALLPWTAPEIVSGACEDMLKADMWSVGCTVIEMSTGAPPWSGRPLETVAFALRGLGGSEGRAVASQLPPGIAVASHHVGEQCLQWEPRRRPAAPRLLRQAYGSEAEVPSGATERQSAAAGH